MKKADMVERLLEIRDEIERLESESSQLRQKLFLKMETGDTVYSEHGVATKNKKKSVELVPKEKIFDVLGEKRFVQLASIGITALRGNISDRMLGKLTKKETHPVVLTVRRLD